jgi:electron transport complex protein RnfB
VDILAILYAFLTISVLGIIFGLGLTVAARFFTVVKNEKLEQVEQILPQINCGACGFAGCAAYAAAVVGTQAALDLCTPGGEVVAKKLAAIMGKVFSFNADRKMTQVHCRGGRDRAVNTFTYRGLQDCTALYLIGGGNKLCRYGCLGQGSCVRVCPVDAISCDSIGLVSVDPEKCIACGKCIDVCPTKVMRWIPRSADFIVACNSVEPGPVTKRACTVGCTACKICEKRSPEGGYNVVEYLSYIDYTQKGDRAEAARKCPPHCIVENRLCD